MKKEKVNSLKVLIIVLFIICLSFIIDNLIGKDYLKPYDLLILLVGIGFGILIEYLNNGVQK